VVYTFKHPGPWCFGGPHTGPASTKQAPPFLVMVPSAVSAGSSGAAEACAPLSSAPMVRPGLSTVKWSFDDRESRLNLYIKWPTQVSRDLSLSLLAA
jgi:hypothetical protein